MRIPGWLVFLTLIVSFVAMTGICAVGSYGFVRTTVIDARENGVELPDVGELVSYVVDPPEFDEKELSFEAFNQARQIRPTPTIVIDYETFVAAQPTASSTPRPGETITPQPSATPTEQTASGDVSAGPTALPAWEDPRRVNVLLMGVDQRSSEFDTERAHRTDTMILVQVDPVLKTIGMLSIPRDLFVDIPGFDDGRITTANYLGDSQAYPGGGPQLAMDTVRANLGVPVDLYVRINFEVFERVVDILAPDGIEICVEEEINDLDFPDEGYGFIQVRFEPGCQQMNTTQLLQYARTRATDGGDFDRNRRQQQVLRALQEHLLSAGGITRFATQIPRLYNELSDSYKTNISLEDVIKLGTLVSDVPNENITSGTINQLHTSFGQMADGAEILVPRQNALADVVAQTFDPPRNLTTAERRERAESENADIVVYNNTTITGLAGSTREWLTGRGVDVAGVGNIDPPQNGTEILIRDYTGNPDTARYLADLMGLPQNAIRPGNDGATSADVMIVVGSDAESLIAAPESTPETED
jgi:polyisoprenyl-teichoic acid--peptidoglycan teichoic acid transferase